MVVVIAVAPTHEAGRRLGWAGTAPEALRTIVHCDGGDAQSRVRGYISDVRTFCSLALAARSCWWAVEHLAYKVSAGEGSSTQSKRISVILPAIYLRVSYSQAAVSPAVQVGWKHRTMDQSQGRWHQVLL